MTFVLNLDSEDIGPTSARSSKANAKSLLDQSALKGKWSRKRYIKKRVESMIKKGMQVESLKAQTNQIIKNTDSTELKRKRKAGILIRPKLHGANSIPLRSRLFDSENRFEDGRGRPAPPSPKRPSNQENITSPQQIQSESGKKDIVGEILDLKENVNEKGTLEKGPRKENPKEDNSEKYDTFTSLGLLPVICRHLGEKMGFLKPTAIQSQMIPAMLNNPGKDIRMQSMTGSGKTLSFVLPLVHRILQNPRLFDRKFQGKDIRNMGTVAVILSPTRELAMQLYCVLEKLLSTRYILEGDQSVSLVPGIIIGGDKRKSEKARLRKGIHILVATPGRLLDHLESTKSFNCTFLDTLVMDEADRLLDLGFEKKVLQIINLIKEKKSSFASFPRTLTSPLQIILCSATLQERVLQLAGEALSSPLVIQATSTSTNDVVDSGFSQIAIPESLSQKYLICPPKLRLISLLGFLRVNLENKKVILNVPFKVVVFLSCCDSVDFHHALLTAIQHDKQESKTVNARKSLDDEDSESSDEEGDLNAKDIAAVAKSEFLFGTQLFKLHGSMNALDRKKIFQDFCNSQYGILFCTDVAARGLDMPAIDLIIQYEAPADWKDYVHRVGRTARNGTTGEALIFLMPNEEPYLAYLKEKGVTVDSQVSLKTTLKDAFNPRKGSKVESSVIEDRASDLQRSIEDLVEKKFKKLGRIAFMSTLRAYSTHPKPERSIFHVKNVHTGHWAKSFGLCDAPSQIGSKESMNMLRRTGKKSIRPLDDGDYKASERKKVKRLESNFNPVSEFDSGI